MNQHCPSTFLLASLFSVFGAAAQASPPDVVSSDSTGNTAMGTSALSAVSGAANNTAAGSEAMPVTTMGSENTAFGAQALYTNTSGSLNTVVGYQAMYLNTTGVANNAFGYQALLANTTGTNNNAIGYGALAANTTGGLNTADGFEALTHNTTGIRNTGIGRWSLYSNTTGSNNIGIGEGGGYYVTGSDNIDIGAAGDVGDNGVIRIGTRGNQTEVYITAALSNNVYAGFSELFIDKLGRVYSPVSSARFKRSIVSIDSQSDKLMKLRPVRFHYKQDKDSDPIQYGLIAEEVNKVYPELVTHDVDGIIHGVRYDELAPLLLHEFQEQHTQVAAQTRELAQMKTQLAEIKALNQSMQLALRQMQDNVVRMAKQYIRSAGGT